MRYFLFTILCLIPLSSLFYFLLKRKSKTKNKAAKKSEKTSFKEFKDLKTDYDRGDYHYNRKNYKQAFEWYQKAAWQGYVLAQYNLGVMYHKGQAVPQDYKQAFHWYQKAAIQGYDLAQFNLAGIYEQDQAVPQDYKQAFHWLQKAAMQGYAPAQANLGEMCYDGAGVKKNLIYAYAWFNLASSNGDKNATKIRDKLAETMSAKQISKAQKLSSQIAQEINENKEH